MTQIISSRRFSATGGASSKPIGWMAKEKGKRYGGKCAALKASKKAVNAWGDEKSPEWRIIFQSCFVPFRSAGFRFAWFARTSDFQADRHSGRSARGCRRNGFSISPAAFSRFAVFCRQARAESRNPGFVLFLFGVPAFVFRGSPGPRIFKRTVIPAGARAVVGETVFRSLPRPFRGSPFFAGKRARRAGIQALASFRERGEAPMFGPRNFGKQAFGFRRIGVFVTSRCRRLRFGHFRRRPPQRRRDLNVKIGFRLSARAFKCDAAGFQRTLAHAGNEAPDSGNARSGRNDGERECRSEKKGNVGRNDSDSIAPRYSSAGLVLTSATFRGLSSRRSSFRAERHVPRVSIKQLDSVASGNFLTGTCSVDPESRWPNLEPSPSRVFFLFAPTRASDLRALAINHGLVSTSANPLPPFRAELALEPESRLWSRFPGNKSGRN